VTAAAGNREYQKQPKIVEKRSVLFTQVTLPGGDGVELLHRKKKKDTENDRKKI
jgi:hypothetical protein